MFALARADSGWTFLVHRGRARVVADDRALVTHMLCCNWAICFSAAASSPCRRDSGWHRVNSINRR